MKALMTTIRVAAATLALVFASSTGLAKQRPEMLAPKESRHLVYQHVLGALPMV